MSLSEGSSILFLVGLLSWMTTMRARRAALEAALRREARIGAGESDELVQRKVDGFFWPMYQWIEELVARTKSSPSRSAQKPCVCIGLSCVQGGGKTTTTRVLEEMLRSSGRKCAVVSLDDVYLTRKEQIAVAQANTTNPLLQVRKDACVDTIPFMIRSAHRVVCVCMNIKKHRGNPGTHDMRLLMELIEKCQRHGECVAVPRFDKSLHNGRGDRLPESNWEAQNGMEHRIFPNSVHDVLIEA